MLRLFPPHLQALVLLLVFVIWVMLLRYFRRSPAIQRFVAEIIGDETPENALLAFEAAKSRLTRHLHDGTLDDLTRRRIESALGVPLPEEATSFTP